MYGINVWDADGAVMLDMSLLLHRVWHQGVYTTSGNYYYAEPLGHEPTLMAVALLAANQSGLPATFTHLTAGGQWTGFSLNFGPGAVTTRVVAFATR